MNYLEKIVAHKREEVEAVSREVPLRIVKSICADAPAPLPFARSVRERNGIIAEFKRSSPSKGIIHAGISPRDVVTDYERAGVSAVSVLTDGEFFGGSVADVREAVGLLGIPVLRKEFIISEYQVYEARSIGASAILLIAAILTRDEATRLAGLAAELGMEVLMELHGEDELGYMVPGVTVAGINNRNLRTFEVDLQHSIRTAGMLPSDLPKISESGIRTIDDMLMLRRGGFDGFLIGENFMREAKPGEACVDFCKKYQERLTNG